MELETKNSGEQKEFKKIPINNPFIRDTHIWSRENELFDKIKTAVLTILLVPVRITVMFIILLTAWALAHVGLYGYTRDDLKLKPLKGWRRKLRTVVGYLFRSLYVVGSANWIRVKGKLATSEEAPILVGAPHSSFFDALVALISGPSSVVGKIEASEIPFYGKLIDYAQPIYVCREDYNSRATTIQDILNRVKNASEWPQILIFPEGTCTNRESLIQFKPGAFYPGLPVQPIIIRYPNESDCLTWTWQGPNVFVLLWKTLTTLHNFVEIEFLPVYNPSDEEIRDPKLYAQNVQRLMAKELNLPMSDYAFDDCKLMDYALRCQLMFSSKIAEVSKLRAKIGLASSQIEEYIVKENFKGTEDYYIKFEEFLQRLKIPANDYSYTLFSFFVDNSQEADVIDFKEYLLHALLLIKMQEAKIEFVKVLFMLYGDAGKVRREQFKQIINRFLKLPSKKLDRLFLSLDVKNSGLVAFDDFYHATDKDETFKRLYEPNRNFRQKPTTRNP